MQNTEVMINNVSVIFTAIATIFAALSAWLSYRVSRGALQFQKSYAKNQSLINELNSVIGKARTIRALISSPLEASDDKIASLESLLLELKASLQYLDSIGIINYKALKIYNVNCLGEMIDQMTKKDSYLTEVIEALEGKVNGTFA